MCKRLLLWVSTAVLIPLAGCSRSGETGSPDAALTDGGSTTGDGGTTEDPSISCTCAQSSDTCAPVVKSVTVSQCHDGQCLGPNDLCPSACSMISLTWQPTPPPAGAQPGAPLRTDAWAAVSVPAAFDAVRDAHGRAADDFRVVVGTNYPLVTDIRTLLWHVKGGVITDETPLFLQLFTGDVQYEQANRVWEFGSGKLWLTTAQRLRSTNNTVTKLYELDGASTTPLGGSALDGVRELTALFAVADVDVYLGGIAGLTPLLLHYDGKTFSTIALPGAKAGESVRAISALSATEVYVLTSAGRLLKGSGSQFTEVATTKTDHTFSLVAALGSVYLLQASPFSSSLNSAVRWTGATLQPECVPTVDGVVDALAVSTTGSVIAFRNEEVWVKADANGGWKSLPKTAPPYATVWGSGTQATYAFVPGIDNHGWNGKGAAYRLP